MIIEKYLNWPKWLKFKWNSKNQLINKIINRIFSFYQCFLTINLIIILDHSWFKIYFEIKFDYFHLYLLILNFENPEFIVLIKNSLDFSNLATIDFIFVPLQSFKYFLIIILIEFTLILFLI